MEQVSYHHLRRDARPRTLALPPFKAMLAAEYAVSSSWRDEICEWLVRSGCLYCCAWGVACEAWHDGVDHANIQRFEGGNIPDDSFIMTTWHERETLAEAMWFAAVCATHPTVDIKHSLIVHISPSRRSKNF